MPLEQKDCSHQVKSENDSLIGPKHPLDSMEVSVTRLRPMEKSLTLLLVSNEKYTGEPAKNGT